MQQKLKIIRDILIFLDKMIKTYTYLIHITPFRVLEKDSKRTTIISNKEDYLKIHSSRLSDFEKDEYLFRSVLVGESFVQINYLKWDEKKMAKPFANSNLEEISPSDN